MENSNRNNEDLFSKRVRAGRRRTYFIDVRTTRSSDYYVTITESKKKFDEDGYERHKIHLYKEDFNKFVAALNETVEHVKTELMPDYDFDQFTRDDDWYENNKNKSSETKSESSNEESNSSDSMDSSTEPDTSVESTTKESDTSYDSKTDEAETWE